MYINQRPPAAHTVYDILANRRGMTISFRGSQMLCQHYTRKAGPQKYNISLDVELKLQRDIHTVARKQDDIST